MNYKIRYNKKIIKFLKEIPQSDAKKIREKVGLLTGNPRPNGVKKLKGRDNAFRIRVGDYRVIYHVEDKQLIVLIIDLDHRKNVYRND